ncbi:tRNA (adenosine(37)-N6)-threonylcarbamoyltransferase complex dimerization subunit type 1 TsaB [Myxococcota bacterium]|nr:tRNA (adenosine(37)-N6)-threonylcarbamoyltransferase complex dimerization subunit type 1 TsaB [Myxococcota bacterium]
MVVLGLDTTTKTGGMALHQADGLEAVCIGDPMITHGERLPGDILEFLDENKLTLGEIDRFAVVSGPGSFTGLRVGLATIQALALTNKKDVVAVPTLEAIVYAGIEEAKALDEKTFLVPWMNAFRGEVFTGVYKRVNECSGSLRDDLAVHVVEVETPRVGKPAAMLKEWGSRLSLDDRQVVILATESRQCDLGLEKVFGKQATWMIGTRSLALTAARIGAGRIGDSRPVKPNHVRPVYIRRPDAVLARERRLKEQSSGE